MEIVFKQVNLKRHFNLCYEFRRDSHFCSFGTYEGYEESVIGYQEKIQQRLNNPSWHYLHIWHEQKIIGQLEFKSFSFLENTGYVHLIYVIPEFRGLGVADKAEMLIAEKLKNQGCVQSLLSVSRENERAVRHYRRFD
ncbi:GNAT family N-acetyltransferase [Leucothrix pacifica]|uniref:N-acetyltransferase n=1 Tax=Leucothrix pacifica TaxID=1247513 RepID=A0A317CQR1_9GAMM|nr:GNAT family N-acetyltransferase [Leucothrix pacifica]PWR00735.1 N-acetyltransferase [Leucothrix pacifica]